MSKIITAVLFIAGLLVIPVASAAACLQGHTTDNYFCIDGTLRGAPSGYVQEFNGKVIFIETPEGKIPVLCSAPDLSLICAGFVNGSHVTAEGFNTPVWKGAQRYIMPVVDTINYVPLRLPNDGN